MNRVENTKGKGEIARKEQFLLFPLCFQKDLSANALSPIFTECGPIYLHTNPKLFLFFFFFILIKAKFSWKTLQKLALSLWVMITHKQLLAKKLLLAKPFPHDKILDQTELRAFADDKCNKNNHFCF